MKSFLLQIGGPLALAATGVAMNVIWMHGRLRTSRVVRVIQEVSENQKIPESALAPIELPEHVVRETRDLIPWERRGMAVMAVTTRTLKSNVFVHLSDLARSRPIPEGSTLIHVPVNGLPYHSNLLRPGTHVAFIVLGETNSMERIGPFELFEGVSASRELGDGMAGVPSMAVVVDSSESGPTSLVDRLRRAIAHGAIKSYEVLPAGTALVSNEDSMGG